MLRASVLRDHGLRLDPEFKYAKDHDFFDRYLHLGNFIPLKEPKEVNLLTELQFSDGPKLILSVKVKSLVGQLYPPHLLRIRNRIRPFLVTIRVLTFSFFSRQLQCSISDPNSCLNELVLQNILPVAFKGHLLISSQI